MTGFAIATEDALSEALAETLLGQAGGHTVAQRLGRRGFGYLKRRIGSLNEIARDVMPVLLVTDLDRAACPAGLIASWLPGHPHQRLLFRVAVREIESWVMADREAFAQLLGIDSAKVPERPDELTDPKAALLNLVRRCKRRALKDEILPRPGVSFPVGLGYNDCLGHFVRENWDSARASRASPSLARALASLKRLPD